jgi:4-diphosphocytidyl-2-C-methyl-D-erythritol kinase
MIVFPTAKINIGLNITEKRSDGFHNIETIFYPIPFCDALEFVESDNQTASDTLIVSGIESIGKPKDNLIIKAIKKLRERKSFPALKIHLHKVIPLGAGLGGGSSNAAFILKGINHLFDLNINNDELKTIALELGSDCPFFIDAVPAFASGRGEILKPLKNKILDNHYIVLVNPAKSISTKAAYMNCRPAAPPVSLNSIIDTVPVAQWKNTIKNDFDEYAFGEEPLIAKLIEEMYRSGAIFSLMSGSGSSVYGIFKAKPQLSGLLKEYLVWEGVINENYT